MISFSWVKNPWKGNYTKFDNQDCIVHSCLFDIPWIFSEIIDFHPGMNLFLSGFHELVLIAGIYCVPDIIVPRIWNICFSMLYILVNTGQVTSIRCIIPVIRSGGGNVALLISTIQRSLNCCVKETCRQYRLRRYSHLNAFQTGKQRNHPPHNKFYYHTAACLYR